MIHMVFTTEGFLEVTTESWPEWDLNPRPLNSVCVCACVCLNCVLTVVGLD